MPNLHHESYSFDAFTLDLKRGCLQHGQQEIKLRRKSFEVLKYLVENSGRLVSKHELIHAVWVDTVVTDDSLVQCLKDVRHALSDETRQIIKTVHGRGYIFNAEVRDVSTAHKATEPELVRPDEDGQWVYFYYIAHGHSGIVIEVGNGPAGRFDNAGLLAAHDVVERPDTERSDEQARVRQHERNEHSFEHDPPRRHLEA